MGYSSWSTPFRRSTAKSCLRALRVTFKVGDKISGISIERIKFGGNGKIAIIGRTMGTGKIKGVRDVYNELKAQGYNNIEIFDESSLSGNWKIEYKNANNEMQSLTQKWTRILDNSEISKTKMYQLNKRWAQKLIDEGYDVIDLGDISAKDGDYRGFSAFYAIEKKIIFEN